MTRNVNLELDAGATLAEGPMWHASMKRLYWLDIIGGTIHCYSPEDRIDEVFHAGKYVSSIVPARGGYFLITKKHAVYEWQPGRSLKKVIAVEQDMPRNRFNDGKCDSYGRLWVGSMDMEEKDRCGSLYVLNEGGNIRRVLSGITVSNGIDWSPDNETMYHVDSPTRRVFSYDFDNDSGTVSNQRTAATIPRGQGFPDGITVDVEGMLWVAQWGGSRVSRWEPGGRMLEEIRIPVSRVSSCAFGGKGLDVLYVTTARNVTQASLDWREEHAGSLFSVEVDVRGKPANTFAQSGG